MSRRRHRRAEAMPFSAALAPQRANILKGPAS